MNRLVVGLVCGVVALWTLASIGPALVLLIDGLVPFVIAVGLVVALLRIVWHYTRRY